MNTAYGASASRLTSPLARAKAQQLHWAKAQGLLADRNGYLDGFESNLLRPMTPAVRASFDDGSGSELLDRGSRPAKMRALVSSSALAVNFFGFWADGLDQMPHLVQAMRLSHVPDAVRFEEKCPTGLRGTPPNLDVILGSSSVQLGIESKFTEWMTPKVAKLEEFRAKYLTGRGGLWEEVGLGRCQSIARLHGDGSLGFQHLDAAQLLKHALGLVSCHGVTARLGYVYWDDGGPGSEAHARELRRFEELLEGELGFQSWRYQEIVASLAPADSLTLQRHLAAFTLRYIG